MAVDQGSQYFERPNVNKEIDIWNAALATLERGDRAMLLVVVESVGSSPGRAGFKALVTSSGALHGSIGGGSMEHKLVELARSRLGTAGSETSAGSLEEDPALSGRTAGSLRSSGDPAEVLLKRQVHRPDEPADRSGMICSGEQTVAFVPLDEQSTSVIRRTVDQLTSGRNVGLFLGPNGLRLGTVPDPTEYSVFTRPGKEWSYSEQLGAADRMVILGAGHVGFALSRTMNQLGFHVHLMDDRAELNTMAANQWAHERTVVDYARIGAWIDDDPDLYVVLVSFGYRTDDLLVRQLIGKRFKYIGMMGSEAKIKTVLQGLRKDGFTEAEIGRIRAPIGLPIDSKTPEEIAVSIAAEIIGVKNRS
jgi:xanthine dehydrogenase accessory factor